MGSVVLVVLVVGLCALHLGKCSNSSDLSDEPRTFEDVEKRLKNVVSSVFKMALPYIMSGSESSMSGACTSSLLKVVVGLRQLKGWAIQMVDSVGKPPSGMLEGTFLAMGNYDECLNLIVTKRDKPLTSPEDELFRGQYCMVEFRSPKVISNAINDYHSGNREDNPLLKTKTFLSLLSRFRSGTEKYGFRLGICLPSKCTLADVQSVASRVSDLLKSNASILHCETKQSTRINTEQIAIITIIGIVIFCVVAATVTDALLIILNKADNCKQSGFLMETIDSFSAYRSIQKLFSVDDSNDPMCLLRGLRVFTVILSMYSYTYLNVHQLHFLKYGSPMNFFRFLNKFSFTSLANSSVGVDTLFFLGGVMIVYPRWKKTEFSKVRLRISDLLIGNYIRMTAIQGLVIALFLLTPLLGTGPIWKDYVEPQLDNCRERWWANILYISNYYGSYKTCMYTTWFMSVLMQLYIITVLILWLLKRKPVIGILFNVILVISGAIGVALVIMKYNLPGPLSAYLLNIKTGPIMWRKVYMHLYDHIGPYCIGVLTGYLVAQHRTSIKMKPWAVAVGWILAAFFHISVIYGLYPYRETQKIEPAVGILYATLCRNAWALSLAWVVVAGATGNGGVVTKLLCWRALKPLDRICYLAYLLQLPVIYFHSGIIRERMHMGVTEQMYNFAAYTLITFTLSAVCFIIFQRPYCFLEKAIRTCRDNKMDKYTINKDTNNIIKVVMDNNSSKALELH